MISSAVCKWSGTLRAITILVSNPLGMTTSFTDVFLCVFSHKSNLSNFARMVLILVFLLVKVLRCYSGYVCQLLTKRTSATPLFLLAWIIGDILVIDCAQIPQYIIEHSPALPQNLQQASAREGEKAVFLDYGPKDMLGTRETGDGGQDYFVSMLSLFSETSNFCILV